MSTPPACIFLSHFFSACVCDEERRGGRVGQPRCQALSCTILYERTCDVYVMISMIMYVLVVRRHLGDALYYSHETKSSALYVLRPTRIHSSTSSPYAFFRRGGGAATTSFTLSLTDSATAVTSCS